MDAIIIEKKALRKQMFVKRNELDILEKTSYDNWICDQLLAMIIDKKAQNVHAYLPFLSEIDINPLLQKLLDLKINVICPKTLPKRQLENRILHSLTHLEIGIKGTLHPAEPTEYKGIIDFIIVPGLAFDYLNFRLGYGGGYYDNFIVNHPNAYKVGVFYPFQQVNKVPTEAHDLSLNTILYRAQSGLIKP